MKKFIKIFILSMMSNLCMAQKSHVDSLKQALKGVNTDSARFVNLYKIGANYRESNRDSALHYMNLAFVIAKENRQLLDEAIVLHLKGYLLMNFGKFPESFECSQLALKLAQDTKSEYSWFRLNNYSPHNMRLYTLGYIHFTRGLLMGATNNIEEEINQFQETNVIASKIGDNDILGHVNMNLGYIYFDLNQLDKALLLEKKAELFYKQTSDEASLANVYIAMSSVYLKKANEKLALEYVQNAIKICIKHNIFSTLNGAYCLLTNYYFSKKQNDSSLYYAKKALSIKKISGSKNFGEAYENLYKSYELLGKKDSAYKYQGLAFIAKDSSFNATTKSLADFQKLSFKAQIRANELEKEKDAIKTRIRTYVLLTAIVLFMAIAITFYRVNLQRQKKNLVLTQQKEELQNALTSLKATQTQLIQSEKMASLGELTAGIAHEIQNPLNFVNNFSEVSVELLAEMDEELDKGDIKEVKNIGLDLKQNLEKINHHGKRADAIVKGMLEHSRAGSGIKEPTDINKLADEYLRLSYHGLRAKDKAFNASLVTNFDEKIPLINVIPQDIGRVLLNLFNNAFYAVNQKAKTAGADYNPTVVVETFFLPHLGVGGLKVKDNGIGIPDAIKDKIMQPFFTTKPTGEGTGLGLSLTYDMVVKGHGGKIEVNSKDGERSEFIVTLPFNI